jgi:hypothetical protein
VAPHQFRERGLVAARKVTVQQCAVGEGGLALASQLADVLEDAFAAVCGHDSALAPVGSFY